MHYTTKQLAEFRLLSVEILLFDALVLLVLLKMQRGDVLCAKRACVLSRNEIWEIVMDPDSDKDKHYALQESEDEEEPRPPSRWSSISRPPCPDYSASSSEDEVDVGNVTAQQPQPSLWTLPPKPRRCVVHTFIGAPNRKSSEAAHITRGSTPFSVLLLFFMEIITYWLWRRIATTTRF